MMDIRFRNATASADVELAAYARRCLQVRLQHCSNRVEHIDVGLGDAGSRSSSQDSYCIVRVQLLGAPPATVVDVHADVYRAIDRAADRSWRVTQEQSRLTASLQATQTEALAA